MNLMNVLLFNPAAQPEQPDDWQYYGRLSKIGKPFLAMLMGDKSLNPVKEMSQALSKMPASELLVKQLKNDPAAAEMIQQRYMANSHNLEELLKYPEDSLGYRYASLMIARGFRSEDLYISTQIDSDINYVTARIRQTHDIWHLITGFDVSEIDEIGLQAFYLAQFPDPLAILLITNSLIAVTLLTPQEIPILLSAMAKGWEMGRKAKPLFAQKWEENWEKPLTEWKTELNIQPA
ncbi:MAG: Coq4 family protein [Cyanobacteriota bacterium]|nr:Coq4 family protein [Cyanobacteriota bacterium]